MSDKPPEPPNQAEQLEPEPSALAGTGCSPGATPEALPAPASTLTPAPVPDVPDMGGLAGTGFSGNSAIANLTTAIDHDG
jgi:hypothetical protein